MPNWKKVIVSGSDATLTSVTATAGFTGSLQGTASYATYAANGGVTKILAGANVNLSPVNGLGDVTVTSFGTNLYNTATGSYGSFYDTGSVLASSATAVYSMSLSTTDISNGVFVSASNGDVTRVKFTNAGTYNLQFSSQFSNTDNSNQDVVIWVRKNGVDIPDSSGVAATPPFKAGSNGQVIAAWNYYLSLSAGDFIQMCWHVEQANVITLETIPAGVGPTHPRTPSTILTATRVDTFLSNTGSFSGSFTGTLQGTASYATNALSASYAPSTPAFPYTGSALITGSLGITGSLSNGDANIASGLYSHAEGSSTTATGDASHTEGQSTNAIGAYSHAEGLATIASGSYQHVQGQFNIASSAQSAFIVGNGANIASRSNLIFAAGSQVQITGSLTVTAGITGSLLGTASYATNALSASWAPGGAGTPTFPYTGSAIITGSLQITGSLFVQDFGRTNIDSSNRYLYDAGPIMPPGAPSVLSVDWGSRTLVRSNGATSVDWGNHTLYRNNIVSLEWGNRIAVDGATSSSIKWEDRELWDGDPGALGFNAVSLDWNNRIAKDGGSNSSINWSYRELYDQGGGAALNWKMRNLLTPNTTVALTWTDNTTLSSDVYQRDFKTAATQDAVSSTINNAYVSYLGDVIEVDGITTFIDSLVTEGMLVYLDTNATWYPVDQATNGSTKLLGIAHNVYAPSGTGFVLLEGHVVIDDTSTSGPYVASAGYGLPIYIEDSTTTGTMSTIVPTTTGPGSNIVRLLGHCYQQNGGTSTQWMMKFRPSNDWVEI